MTSIRPLDPIDMFYFCDESSFLDDDFMGVAGIAVNKTRIPDIIKDLCALKEKHQDHSKEIKWNNVRPRGMDIRKAYIDYLVELSNNRLAHFHIRFSPMNEYSHAGPRGRFDTASKSFYQLLLHRAVRHYGHECRIFIRPDDGSCTSELGNYKDALHHDGRNRYKTPLTCIDSIIPLNSKNEPLLQLLDISLGALTAYRNGRHLNDAASKYKRELAEYAYKAFGVRDLTNDCYLGPKFSVWNVIPKKNVALTLERLRPSRSCRNPTVCDQGRIHINTKLLTTQCD